MSGSCRNPASEPAAQHNKLMDEIDFHKTLRTALIPPQVRRHIERLETENKRLLKIMNMAGGSPAPATLQFSDMLLPLEDHIERLKDTMDLIMTYMHTLTPESVATRFEWIRDKIEQCLKSLNAKY